MKVHLILFIIIVGIFNNPIFGQSENIVLKTDINGEITFGSIESLIAHIQNGKSIRVGWQHDLDKDSMPDLEHWIDADFISVLNGHVFNQITPIYRQSPKMSIPQIQIIESSMMWTGVIGTNGLLMSRYIIPEMESIEDENIYNSMKKQTEIKERKVATIWAIKE